MEKLKPYAFLLLGAVFYTLGFPNITGMLIPFAPIIGTTILVSKLIKQNDLKTRVFYYLFYNLIITLLSFYWIANTIKEFGKVPFPLAVIFNIFYAPLFNPHYWVMIVLLFLLEKRFSHHLQDKYLQYGANSIVFAAILTMMEYFIPQQFPVMLGQPWIIFSDFLGLAPVLGLPAFSFVSYLLVFELVRLFKSQIVSKLNLIIILLFILINPIVSLLSSPSETVQLNTRIVQANISNFLKTSSEDGSYASTKEVIERYEKLSLLPFPHAGSLDLIVWPETAYPYPIDSDDDDITKTDLPEVFYRIINRARSNILFGGYDHYKSNPNGDYYQTEYNSALFVNRSSKLEDVYHKHILIPFGETLPFGPLNRFASKYIPEMAFFATGTRKTLFHTSEDIKFITTICYEILRPEFLRDYLNSIKQRPNLMINLTNDSWYGDTVEPEQHLFLTKWRTIEFGIPLLRATNNGISTFVNHEGIEVQRLGYGKTGNLDLELSLPVQTSGTIFQKLGIWGNVPLWLLCFIFHIFLIKFHYGKDT